MHILIAIITAVGGLIWALVRLQNSGVDLNSFNPFWWARRRKWQKLHGTNPLHAIESSMEAAAVLVVGIAKIDVEVTRETKKEIQDLFVEKFNLSQSEANDLFVSSSHLLKDSIHYTLEIKNILEPSLATFTDIQKSAVLEMLEKVSNSEGSATPEQVGYIEEVKKQFQTNQVSTKSW